MLNAMSHDILTIKAWDEKHLRAANHAAGVALWSWNVDTDAITMDDRAYDLWEVSKEAQNITFEILAAYPSRRHREGQVGICRDARSSRLL